MKDQERKRLEELSSRERSLRRQYRHVAGVDEAGRGSLAGPVVAGAVILGDGIYIEGLNDSKKVTPTRRERLFEEIRERSVAVGVGMIYQGEIDSINIFNATVKAMHRAVGSLAVRPDYLLVDGLALPGYGLPQEKVIDGDTRCSCIAAASIVAKVTRDRLMCELDKLYPQYGFARHKGYGTAYHMTALKKYRPCDIHRKSFQPVVEAL